MLTVELLVPKLNVQSNDVAEVAICCDAEGLERLIAQLEKLRHKRDHTHLMTPSWAGNELTEEKQGGKDYVLVNHLRVVKVS
jgi:hypothetical protein